MIKLKRSLLIPYAFIMAGLFVMAYATLGLDRLIMVLNGGFIGALLAITVTYSRVVRAWFWGSRPDDSVSMFGLFFMVLWAVIGIGVFSSIYIRASNLDYTTLISTAINRYALIFCAWGLIASLDYGEPMFFGMDRKLMYGGITAGLIVAAILVYAQEYKVLS